MSEVIEEYIRRNGGMRETEAFEGFLQQDRIKAWVGADDARKERLRREFSRVWTSLHPPSTPSRPGTSARPERDATVQVEMRRAIPARPVEAPPTPAPVVQKVRIPPRRLTLLCPNCSRMDVWVDDNVIGCRSCHRAYEDMLTLVPVKPLPPFAFVFGEGWKGWATAGGVAVGIAALYLLLRGL